MGELAKLKQNENKRGRFSMRLQWMNEFSDVGSEMSHDMTLKMAKIKSSHLQYPSSDMLDNISSLELPMSTSDRSKEVRRVSTIGVMKKMIEENKRHFENINSRSFNIFEVEKAVGRNNTLSAMTL